MREKEKITIKYASELNKYLYDTYIIYSVCFYDSMQLFNNNVNNIICNSILNMMKLIILMKFERTQRRTI